jgi:hypothetical protein
MNPNLINVPNLQYFQSLNLDMLNAQKHILKTQAQQTQKKS